MITTAIFTLSTTITSIISLSLSLHLRTSWAASSSCGATVNSNNDNNNNYNSNLHTTPCTTSTSLSFSLLLHLRTSWTTTSSWLWVAWGQPPRTSRRRSCGWPRKTSAPSCWTSSTPQDSTASTKLRKVSGRGCGGMGRKRESKGVWKERRGEREVTKCARKLREGSEEDKWG